MLKKISLDDRLKWDSIVSSFKNYDVYWLSGYVKTFQIHGDGEPLLFYYEDENCRGINVVMKRDIADDPHFSSILKKNKWFDFATPYGYGGWVIEGDNPKFLFEEYFNWCKDNNIVSEFVRFHPVINNQIDSRKYYEVVDFGHTICMDISDKELIINNMTAKNRNHIRRSISSGVLIKSGYSKDLLDSFIDIYNSTMEKDNAENYYYFDTAFYNSIFSDLRGNATIFYAEYNKIIIAASIILFANGKLNYHLSGSKREYQSLAPTNLLLCEAAKWGFENGMKTFHLGGGVGGKEDALFKFKKAFYKFDNMPYFCIGKKIINYEKYNELVAFRDTISNGVFFPEYRQF